ncbi:MAG: serine/threonine-protein phosphatase [Polyangiaceae bacterium]|nr:serine/threonine-protein phosphatase [Polyangiaceae bacterium]
MTTPWPRIVVAERTDPGQEPEKQENEDASRYVETHAGHLVVLCDGMGGHSSGREASNLAIETIVARVAAAPAGADPGLLLATAIGEAGRRVFALGGAPERVGRPGSTCVGLLMHPGGTEIAHVGDSRIYVVRAGQIWPLTRDHSVVQEMIHAGLIKKEEAAGHPDSNKITRALGMKEEVEVELRPDIVLQQRGDVFLTTSDGVTDVVADSDLLAISLLAIAAGSPSQLCEQVVQLANARGGPDNITVQAVFVHDPGLRPGASAARTEAAPVAPQPPATAPATATPAAAPSHRTVPDAPAPEAVTPLVRGGTMRMSVFRAPPAPPATSPGAEPSPAPPPQPKGVASTLVDVEDEPPPSRPPRRGARLPIGLVVAALGVVALVVGVRRLLGDDEAPAPLVESPAASASSAR